MCKNKKNNTHICSVIDCEYMSIQYVSLGDVAIKSNILLKVEEVRILCQYIKVTLTIADGNTDPASHP